ncbi:MAG: glycosyltransferase [Candidatus Omnitrophica bacterium]|nr:glycosyltransferase [Candidatus Omnitrophota bacterium]
MIKIEQRYNCMTKNYSISAVILSKNSEKKIEKCLESLAGWADEILLVDGGSTDKTADIAKRFGAKVYFHAFSGSFAEERNFGTEKASSDWVLQLDSDEIVSDAFKKKCDEILPGTKCAAFKFRRKNVFLGHEFTYGGWYHWSQHLFKNLSARYEGRVHEKMVVNGNVGFIDADMLHIPFDSISEFIERQNRYTDLQAADIIDQEKDLTRKKIKYNLKVKPAKLFRKIYFNKKGYKEGLHGLIFAILSSYVHFLKWAKVWERTKNRKKILIVRNDRFGEFLLNIPAIRAVKETFKESKIILAVDPYVKELAGKVPHADEVIIWKNGKHSLFETIRFSFFLKKKDIDIAIIMNPSKDTNIAAYLANIPERIGYDHKWSFLLTKRKSDLKHLGQKHEVEYNLDLVKLAGVASRHCEEDAVRLFSDEAIFKSEIASASLSFGLAMTGEGIPLHRNDHEEFFDNTIAIHPWTSDPAKQWPEERFRELALRIVKETNSGVLIVGGPEELQKSAIFNNFDKRIDNLTGKTTLVELASILKKSKLLISGDSGPIHLACAVGTPVIALFRNDMPGKGPKRWGPWGEGNVVIEKKSLSDISVEEVMKAIIDLVL